MTYNVFSGTLNPAQSINHVLGIASSIDSRREGDTTCPSCWRYWRIKTARRLLSSVFSVSAAVIKFLQYFDILFVRRQKGQHQDCRQHGLAAVPTDVSRDSDVK